MAPHSRFRLLVPFIFWLSLGCNKSKPVPTGDQSANASPGAGQKQDEGQPGSGQQALPPEQAFARRGMAPEAPPPAAPPKSGVCAFQENGYDNQDTRSEEKLVVKINEDRIVHASYHYKGSYQLEGVGDLSVPIKDGKWVSFEIPMASGGVGKYQVKLDGDMMLFKGTANDRPHGQCRWEKPEGK